MAAAAGKRGGGGREAREACELRVIEIFERFINHFTAAIAVPSSSLFPPFSLGTAMDPKITLAVGAKGLEMELSSEMPENSPLSTGFFPPPPPPRLSKNPPVRICA